MNKEPINPKEENKRGVVNILKEKDNGEIMACKICQNQIDEIKKQEKLNEEELFILRHPKKSLLVNYPVKMDNGKTVIISGIRVQYNDALGPTKGGLRFHQNIDFEEVSELAFLMSLKTSLVGIPFGGAKGGIKINPKKLSENELEKVSRGFVREVKDFIGPKKDIPAPDVNTNPKIMGWMMSEFEKITGKYNPEIVTGKPVLIGGSLGRDKSTARGAFHIINEKYKDIGDKSKLTVAIQGFGNAGSNLALMLEEIGLKIIAVSDSSAGIYNLNGLKINDLIKFKSEGKYFKDYKKEEKIISNEELLNLEVDLLIPASLGGVITEKNADKIKAKNIVEVANGPITKESDLILEKKNIEIIPDILANSGGVIVSYFEWVQNLQNYYWSEEDIEEKLKKRILHSYSKVLNYQKEHPKYSLRTASYSLAIRKILDAEKMRGNL